MRGSFEEHCVMQRDTSSANAKPVKCYKSLAAAKRARGAVKRKTRAWDVFISSAYHPKSSLAKRVGVHGMRGTTPTSAVRMLKTKSFVTGFAWAGAIGVVVGVAVVYTAKRRIETALLAAGVDPSVVSSAI